MIDARIGPVLHSDRSRNEVMEKLMVKYNGILPLSLEIGCGENPQPGYIHTDSHVDMQNKDLVDVQCDATDLPFPDESMRSVLMFGVFEHLGIFEASEALLEVSRVLMNGGVFKFDVPDFDWFIEVYRNRCTKDPNTGIGLDPCRDMNWVMHAIFGGQDHEGMFHKWGWNEDRLTEFLKKPNFEFSEVKLVGRQWRDPEANHLIYECTRRQR